MDELKTFRQEWPVWRMICVMLHAVITAGLVWALFRPDFWLSWLCVGLSAAVIAVMLATLVRDLRRLPRYRP